LRVNVAGVDHVAVQPVRRKQQVIGFNQAVECFVGCWSSVQQARGNRVGNARSNAQDWVAREFNKSWGHKLSATTVRIMDQKIAKRLGQASTGCVESIQEQIATGTVTIPPDEDWRIIDRVCCV